MVDWVREYIHMYSEQLRILGVERGTSYIRRQLPCVLENHGEQTHAKVRDAMREKVREAKAAEQKRLEKGQ